MTPTEVRGGVPVNTDPGLERDADTAGASVAQGFELDASRGFGVDPGSGAATGIAQGADLAPAAPAATPSAAPTAAATTPAAPKASPVPPSGAADRRRVPAQRGHVGRAPLPHHARWRLPADRVVGRHATLYWLSWRSSPARSTTRSAGSRHLVLCGNGARPTCPRCAANSAECHDRITPGGGFLLIAACRPTTRSAGSRHLA